MSDILDIIMTTALNPSEHPRLRQAIVDQLAVLRASAGRGDRNLVAQAEQDVRKNPSAAFSLDAAGHATLSVAEHRWHAGRFKTVSIGELRERARRSPSSTATSRVRLWVFDGASPVTDIGSLQATSSASTLFQVASQFNCLESPGPYVADVAVLSFDRAGLVGIRN